MPAPIQKHLFKFAKHNDVLGGSAEMGAAPELLHISENSGMMNNHKSHITAETSINVVETFGWHASPLGVTTLEKTPYVDMVEHDILSNPMLNQIAANLSVAGAVVPDMIKDEVNAQASSYRDDDEVGFWQRIESGLDPTMLDSDATGSALLPYHNMYSTNPTGFRYLFPYFSSTHHQIANTFSTDSGETGTGLGSGILKLGTEATEAIAAVSKGISGNIVAPGSYIEKSKFYGFSGREKTYQFNFPLSNTRSIGDLTAAQTISRNWQLVFLLLYQNSPNRMSRDLILPPCIYEAHIPGVWYSKYAYISTLNVEFLGTRRMMDVALKSLGEGQAGETSIAIQAIIPDVFNITIGLTELVAESQNMMWHMSKGRDVITTGSIGNNLNESEFDD